MKYLNSALQYDEPVVVNKIKNIAEMSWADVTMLADEAAKNPGKYTDYIGQEKILETWEYQLLTRIVDVGKLTLMNGGTSGFIFDIYVQVDDEEFLYKTYFGYGDESSFTDTDIYSSLLYSYYLEGELTDFPLERLFDIDGDDFLYLLEDFEVKYHSIDDRGTETEYARMGIMSASNMYWSGCNGIDDRSLENFIRTDEGEPYTYYKQNDIPESRIHYFDTSGEAQSRTPAKTVLQTITDTPGTFLAIGEDGKLTTCRSDDEETYFLFPLRFCLGSSQGYKIVYKYVDHYPYSTSGKTPEIVKGPFVCRQFWYDKLPSRALAGEKVVIDSEGFPFYDIQKDEVIGWSTDTDPVIDNNFKIDHEQSIGTIEFIMPEHDVVVYLGCSDGMNRDGHYM